MGTNIQPTRHPTSLSDAQKSHSVKCYAKSRERILRQGKSLSLAVGPWVNLSVPLTLICVMEKDDEVIVKKDGLERRLHR